MSKRKRPTIKLKPGKANKTYDGLPIEAYSQNGRPYVRVRLRLPHHIGRYFKKDHLAHEQPWVTQGYTIWTIDEWRSRFGRSYGTDGREWEFFGETIEVWPKDE